MATETVSVGGSLPAVSGSLSLVKGGALSVSVGGQLPAITGSATLSKWTCAESAARWNIFMAACGEAASLWAIGSWAWAESSSPYAVLLEVESESGYSIGIWVLAENDSTWKILLEKEIESGWILYVERAMESILAVRIEAESAALYALLWPVAKDASGPYAILDYNAVSTQLTARYSLLAEAFTSAAWSLMATVLAQMDAPYTQTVSVLSEAAAPYGILSFNPAFAQGVAPYVLISTPAINITGQPEITHMGRTVKIIEASVSADEDGYGWAASIALADPADYARMSVDDEFTLGLYGEQFSLIVDARTINRDGPGRFGLTLSGISPTARLVSPRAKPVTKTWDAAVSAKAAAEEAAGQTIDWRIDDWIIPAGRLAFTDTEPLSIVRRIAEAAGGVLETKPDGTLLVRHRFPVSVKDWPSAAVDHTYTDAADNLAATEMTRSLRRVNRLAIRDLTAERSARIEYVRDPASSRGGALRVYPRPWRGVQVVHTGAPHVVLLPLGPRTREVEELVEFRAGKASAGYPVYQLTSVEWRRKDLGAVSFTQDGEELSASGGGYSLAFVKYVTRSVDAEVSDPVDETVQFLVIEEAT